MMPGLCCITFTAKSQSMTWDSRPSILLLMQSSIIVDRNGSVAAIVRDMLAKVNDVE